MDTLHMNIQADILEQTLMGPRQEQLVEEFASAMKDDVMALSMQLADMVANVYGLTIRMAGMDGTRRWSCASLYETPPCGRSLQPHLHPHAHTHTPNLNLNLT